MNTNKDGTQLDITESTPPVEEEKSNVVPLVIIGGGKGGEDWLSSLPIGCHFWVKHHDSNIYLVECWKLATSGKVVILSETISSQEKINGVDPLGYSKVHLLYEIISD